MITERHEEFAALRALGLLDERRAHRDDRQRVAQVVRDHREHVVPGRHRGVLRVVQARAVGALVAEAGFGRGHRVILPFSPT